MTELNAAAIAALPAQNQTREPRRLHMELMDFQHGDVWLLQEPVTVEEFKALAVEPPMIKSGMTSGAMDCAGFARSPGADTDGALETRQFGGRVFARVARVRRFGGLPRGPAPTLIKVEKDHILGYDAGRTLSVALLPDGHYYVEQTEPRPGQEFVTPAGWQLLTLRLDRPWVLRVASPADVYFFSSLRSFIGPLDLSQLPAVPAAGPA